MNLPGQSGDADAHGLQKLLAENLTGGDDITVHVVATAGRPLVPGGADIGLCVCTLRGVLGTELQTRWEHDKTISPPLEKLQNPLYWL
jgi:hypothetical protein